MTVNGRNITFRDDHFTAHSWGENMEVAILDNRHTGHSPINEIDLDSRGYPTGNDGTVWGTFDLRQADIIRNALLTQHITCELTEEKSDGRTLHLLRVDDRNGRDDALNFIWRETSGLRLKPDWQYVEGATNKSFEQWLGGL